MFRRARGARYTCCARHWFRTQCRGPEFRSSWCRARLARLHQHRPSLPNQRGSYLCSRRREWQVALVVGGFYAGSQNCRASHGGHEVEPSSSRLRQSSLSNFHRTRTCRCGFGRSRSLFFRSQNSCHEGAVFIYCESAHSQRPTRFCETHFRPQHGSGVGRQHCGSPCRRTH